MSNASFKGGDKLSSLLTQYVKDLSGNKSVNVGFFAGSTETKTGIPSAQAALLNEYGGSVTVETKDGKSATRTTPPRPFFREMIKDGQPHWGENLGAYLIQRKMNVNEALRDIGERMKEELQLSIQLQRYAPLAPSTIAKKGHAQTLIDTGDMIHAVDYEVNV